VFSFSSCFGNKCTSDILLPINVHGRNFIYTTVLVWFTYRAWVLNIQENNPQYLLNHCLIFLLVKLQPTKEVILSNSKIWTTSMLLIIWK
jgi:hypothetical protein